MKKFKISEIIIVIFTLLIILVSEYYYIVEGNVNKAIFIGLWPPTIFGLLNYINSKTRRND